MVIGKKKGIGRKKCLRGKLGKGPKDMVMEMVFWGLLLRKVVEMIKE